MTSYYWFFLFHAFECFKHIRSGYQLMVYCQLWVLSAKNRLQLGWMIRSKLVDMQWTCNRLIMVSRYVHLDGSVQSVTRLTICGSIWQMVWFFVGERIGMELEATITLLSITMKKYPLAVKLGTITTDLETTGKSLIDSLLEFGFFLFSVHCKISNKIKVIMAIKINPKLDK